MLSLTLHFRWQWKRKREVIVAYVKSSCKRKDGIPGLCWFVAKMGNLLSMFQKLGKGCPLLGSLIFQKITGLMRIGFALTCIRMKC